MRKTRKQCKYCKASIPKRARICPYCQKKQGLETGAKVSIAACAGLLAVSGILLQTGTISRLSQTFIETSAGQHFLRTVRQWTPQSATPSYLHLADTSSLPSAPSHPDITLPNFPAMSPDELQEQVRQLKLRSSLLLSIYQDYENAWNALPDDPEERERYESETSRQVAHRYGLSSDSTDRIYMYVLQNYDTLAHKDHFETSDMHLRYNKLVDVIVSQDESRILLKARLEPNLTKHLSVQSCFFDAYNAVQQYNLDLFEEVQFEGVSESSNHAEQTLIRFTLPQDILEQITIGGIARNQLSDHVNDVWIGETLR